MSGAQLLPTFIAWASEIQQRLLVSTSPYGTTLQVGRATDNRAAIFTVERFKVELTGWIGGELERGGTLTVWENGCADADWAEPIDLEGASPSPSYQQHWDDLLPSDITSAFAPFTNKIEGL